LLPEARGFALTRLTAGLPFSQRSSMRQRLIIMPNGTLTYNRSRVLLPIALTGLRNSCGNSRPFTTQKPAGNAS
jgi:hypothetical protein